MELLKKFAFGADSDEGSESRYTDRYKGKEILIITTEDFPAHLFNGNFSGFDNTYMALLEIYLSWATASKP